MKTKFQKLANQWKNESRFLSTVSKKIQLDSYQEIIKMGIQVVPFIIQDLKENGPNDWFCALSILTKQNPIKQEFTGNMELMTNAWINWYEKNSIQV